MKDYIKTTWRWLPLTLIVIGLISVWYLNLIPYLSFSYLKEHHLILKEWVQNNYFLTVILFLFIYIVTVTLSIPGATVLTLAGGFLFGPVAIIYVIVGATIGATCLFLAVKIALGDFFASKAQHWLIKMEQGFRKNAFNYLLFLRLLPIFPFWAVNIAAGLLNVRLKIFVIATLIGIIPGVVVYVFLGNSLNIILSNSETLDLNIIFKPIIFLPLMGLAFLAILPVFIKKK